jgi:hypothetical protein
MAALAASTTFTAALESLRVTSFPDGVNNSDYLEFEDRFKGLLTLTGTEEMGRYGLLPWILTFEQWRVLPGNELPDDEVRQQIEIPDTSEPESLPPPEGAPQAAFNAYNAGLAMRNRLVAKRSTLLQLYNVLYAVLIDDKWFSTAMVSKSRSTGDAVTLAIESPLMRFERINKKLNKPNKKTLDAWKAAYKQPVE